MAVARLRALDAKIIAGDETLDKIAKIKLFGGPVPGPAASRAALRHWARPS